MGDDQTPIQRVFYRVGQGIGFGVVTAVLITVLLLAAVMVRWAWRLL